MGKRLPIGAQLSGLLGSVIALMVLLLGVVLYEFDTTSGAYQHLLSVTVDNSITLLRAEDDFHQGLSELRSYVVTKDSAAASRTEDALKKAEDQITRFSENAVNPDSKQLGQQLRTGIHEYNEHTKRVIAAYQSGDANAYEAARSELYKQTEDVNSLFEKTADVQKQVRTGQMEDLNDNAHHIFIIALVASLVGIIAIIACATWYARKLARRLMNLRNDVGKLGKLDLSFPGTRATWNDEIGDMANELIDMKNALHDIVRSIQSEADGLSKESEALSGSVQSQMQVSESIAHTITEVAADATHNNDSIGEISTAIEQVSARTQEMSASGAYVTQTADDAVADAKGGMKYIHELVQQNETVADSMTEISRVSEQLVTGSDAIKNVVTTIREIAGQTNLLALNAAIEAARAGEAGRGFAVVAEEVRKLAEQSSAATNEIEQTIGRMIESIQVAAGAISNAEEKVDASKEVTVETEKSFNSIQKRLEDVRASITQISKAVDETAGDMQAVVGNVQSIGTVAEKTGANAENVAAASEEQSASLHDVSDSAESLSHTASKLNDITSKFKL
ncbi:MULTISPECIES: methyl-accepting chemotaxis protein [Selenomonas]|uniref:Methyl-accepting chemotaxis protein signaling domain protein n=1 Tax=Selenomonas artemidis F0399 TaxID=749551 RepID=E7N4N0_9FIRM|nr:MULTISPECIES: methyl-accepting chemotaxis protein [Selenomonas]EFW28862.1 methyl-accepting chemotaxis protein signaling domain protein [Selenomonas artemidis F0399]EJP29942.1 signal transduction four helix bundle sensory module [Selenomonas sp. FOBRC9]